MLSSERGLVVIDRRILSGASPSIPFSAVDVITRYRGVEGLAWPDEDMLMAALGLKEHERYELLFSGLVSIHALDAVRDYYSQVTCQGHCDLIYCVTTGAAPPNIELDAPTGFTFGGYDFGYYLGASSNFSSLYSDVIYGQYEPLLQYSDHLNEHLLLPSLPLALEYGEVRGRLANEGAHLEVDEPGQPIAIFIPEPGILDTGIVDASTAATPGDLLPELRSSSR